VGEVADVAESLLRRSVALMLVRRRVNGGDAKFATPLLEKTMDVHGLGVRLDGDVLGVMTTLFDVVEEFVEHVRRLRFLLEEVGVSVTR
jgi:hypothetical protein